MKNSSIFEAIGWLSDSNPNVGWSESGYCAGRRLFGCRAGPESDIENLFHEFSHAILCVLEGKIENLREDNYGLSLPSKEVLGRIVVEPTSGKITLTEIKTIAIQRVLMDSVSLKVRENYFMYWAEVLDFLPDYMFYTPKRLVRKLGYKGYEESRHRRVSSLIFTYYEKYRKEFDNIKLAWHTVCEFNKNDLSKEALDKRSRGVI